MLRDMPLLSADKYVVAVSGGVDSVVMLDLLSKQDGLELIVAHFDHGIRPDSAKDRVFVEGLAKKYSLPFEYAEGKLGPSASEERARKVRYDFLQKVREDHRAKAIVTAHHQDDVLETMLINLVRGTKQKGMTSLEDRPDVRRPLLNISRTEIEEYARANNLSWREDPTNDDTKYLRNWVRHNVVRKLSNEERQKLLDINKQTKISVEELEPLLKDLGAEDEMLDKKLLVQMPHDVAAEYVAHWLRTQNINDFDRRTIERIVVGIKTLKAGKSIEVKHGATVTIDRSSIRLVKTG